MRIEIKSAQEWTQFEKARQDCVVTSSLYAYLHGTTWASPDWAVMVWEDEDMVSNVHIIERTVLVDNHPVRVGGIGNIATKVEWRKRGYATSAFKVAMDYLRDPLKVDFGLMIATENMIMHYVKFGWKLVAQSILIDQPQGKRSFSIPVLILPVYGKEWPQGEINVCGLPW
jgi:predicted acetyltransferase